MEHLKIKEIKGKIFLQTGLHIGGGTESIEIGGIDNPVIKDPKSGYPYIPGSSLKGKMRSLLELQKNQFEREKGGPCKCGKCIICKVFGNTATDSTVGMTRAIFRDCFLDEDSIKMLQSRNLLATEAKMENSIDRIKGRALNPRTSERVIAGLSFDFEIAVRVFANDNENELVSFIGQGMQLLQKDALGGSGSRGYGKIEFRNVTCDGAEMPLKG